jgi:hypothetical protein
MGKQAMWINLFLAVGSALAARLLWAGPGAMGSVALGFAGLSAWQLYCALSHALRPRSPIILRLGGFSWTIEDFCRGWLITGETGSGKSLSAINALLWQVSKNCPNWGGVCVDEKGLYWETLSAMFKNLGRSGDLLVLQVRPEGAPADWKPVHTFNFLEDPYLPFSAKAKMVCDVASSQGQRTEQSFFRIQAQVQMEFAFRVLEAAKFAVTLENAYELVTNEKLLKEVMDLLTANESPKIKALAEHYQSNFVSQPAEQLGGVKTTVANYLKYFTDPDIAAVFCPKQSTFRMCDIDRGKVICVSLPQRFQVERRYVNTLLKLAFYAHALRRFDESESVRAGHNLALCCADEAPRTLTASHDGMSDYNVVDVIRQARATFIAAAQTYTSLIPPMDDERKARVFIANMANRITFKAADEESAKIAADTLGKRKTKKRTYGYTAGKRSVSYTDEDKYWIEPHELRRLRKFQAVVQHCEHGFRKVTLPPLGPDGKALPWYRN